MKDSAHTHTQPSEVLLNSSTQLIFPPLGENTPLLVLAQETRPHCGFFPRKGDLIAVFSLGKQTSFRVLFWENRPHCGFAGPYPGKETLLQVLP